MFVSEDDSIWAMGKGLLGPEDEGWIREIPRPLTCNSYKKVIHSRGFRLLLTEFGQMFVNGSGFDDILTLRNESNVSAIAEFQEVDIERVFE